VDVSPSGFLVMDSTRVGAPAARVYDALVGSIGQWWDPLHTFSGDARNLSIDARPGGCFCETLPNNGGVRHLTVVFVSPGKTLRLEGGLGPLQSAGLAGSLTWDLEESAGNTIAVLTYSVGGYYQGGFAEIAPAVDFVMRSQLLRLKSYVETGRPEPK